MKKALIVLALIAVPLYVWNCSSDIILEEEAPIEGEYEGIYYLTTDYGNTAVEVTDSQYIFWTFTEENFIMILDTTRNLDICDFCRVDGVYAFSDGIRLQIQHYQPDGNAGCTACNENHNPEGRFRKETQGSEIVLKQLDGTTYHEIRLTKLADE
ncbi:MAG TPA: hypothetical protein PLF13_04030 [candidate division Zixibacteria bacterium]|nr:hypothetical protein [candidate division Zixibacteria bacterium]